MHQIEKDEGVRLKIGQTWRWSQRGDPTYWIDRVIVSYKPLKGQIIARSDTAVQKGVDSFPLNHVQSALTLEAGLRDSDGVWAQLGAHVKFYLDI